MDVCSITKLDRIRNEIIRLTTKVGEISKKVQYKKERQTGSDMS